LVKYIIISIYAFCILFLFVSAFLSLHIFKLHAIQNLDQQPSKLIPLNKKNFSEIFLLLIFLFFIWLGEFIASVFAKSFILGDNLILSTLVIILLLHFGFDYCEKSAYLITIQKQDSEDSRYNKGFTIDHVNRVVLIICYLAIRFSPHPWKTYILLLGILYHCGIRIFYWIPIMRTMKHPQNHSCRTEKD
jgi:hypothetical protein